ncbi:MAG: DUF6599 family protein, partial [Acidobacteriaceae bacterium]
MLCSVPPFRLAFVSTALVACSLLPQMVRAQVPLDATLSKKVIATAAPAPLLPESFAGFELQGKLEKITEPGMADAGNAQVLVEDGFRDFASGTYKNNVNTVTVRAMRFADASGAYAAYTFYRIPGMAPEDIGQGGAANGDRVLFWNGATVVDAKFDHLTAMSAAALRELAERVPKVGGSAGVPPALPGFLPRTDLEPTHTRYSLGPQGYTRSGGVLPAALVDFGKSPEVLSGGFNLRSGEGTLTIIEYPTPQIAAERERAIAAYLKGGNQPQQPFTAALESSNAQALATRRSGLLVAITSGGFDAADAHKLLDKVNYEASVTWNNPAGYVPETTKAARLLVNVVTFCLITCGATFLLGLFLGGGRALYRIARGKPASSVEEMEFIKLNLR